MKPKTTKVVSVEFTFNNNESITVFKTIGSKGKWEFAESPLDDEERQAIADFFDANLKLKWRLQFLSEADQSIGRYLTSGDLKGI